MSLLDKKLVDTLTNFGWTVDCESPLEIRNIKDGSVATGQAAKMVIEHLRLSHAYDLELTFDELEFLKEVLREITKATDITGDEETLESIQAKLRRLT